MPKKTTTYTVRIVCTNRTIEEGGFYSISDAIDFVCEHTTLGPRTKRNLAARRTCRQRDGTHILIWIGDEGPAYEPLGGQSPKTKTKAKAKTKAKTKAKRRKRGTVDAVTQQGQPVEHKTARPKLSQMLAKAAKGKAKPASDATGAPHGVVKARAGTGKTFTLVLGVAYSFWSAKLKATCKRNLGFDPVPSTQQKQIWDFMAMEPFETAQYIAFNKSIVKDFSFTYKWLVKALTLGGCSLSFSTIHSLGFRTCSRAYGLRGRRAVNKWKTRELLSAAWGKDLRELWKTKGPVIQAIEDLVSKCKITLTGVTRRQNCSCTYHCSCPTETEINITDQMLDQLRDHFEITVSGADREEVYDMVRTLVAKSRSFTDYIDFDDQIWLPVVNDLPIPVANFLMVDEGQDLNACQQSFALRAGQRVLLVGDVAQAIYGFAGADVESIPRMVDRLGATERGVQEFSLTVTRRCAKAIVRRVQRLVPDFEAHPDNPEGEVLEVDHEKGVGMFADKDMVLCRTNAPLIGVAFRLLKEGRKANIQGRDIGQGLKSLIKKSKAKDVGALLQWIDDFHQEESQRLSKQRHPNEAALTAIGDKCDCIRVLCEGATTLSDVDANIDAIFQGRVCPKCHKKMNDDVEQCYSCKVDTVKPEGILLSSIHRSKGLEADRVFIMCPELLPHPMAKTQWARRQETHLQYVAETRAKTSLVIMNGGVS